MSNDLKFVANIILSINNDLSVSNTQTN